MSQNIADMPGIEAAMERFDAMVPAAPAATETAGGSATGNQSTATRAQTKADAQPTVNTEPLPHGRGSDDAAQNSVSLTTDTRAATDTQQTVTGAAGGAVNQSSSVPQRGTTEDRQRDDKGRFTATDKPLADVRGSDQSPDREGAGKSRYAKAQERLEKTWEAVNKRKSDLDAQAQQLEQQRHTLDRDQAQFEAVRRQAEQPQATPEQALQAAQLRRRDADALRMQAKRAEDAGRFDEAQRLNKQADKAESLADELGSYAEELRKNPPVSLQQRAQQFEQARKQWTVEACNAFPDLAKNGSRLQQVVAQHLDALAKQDPQLLVHPSLIYHVARLADAQNRVADLQSVAARVPVLEKETESLRARIKELEAETTPAGNGGVSRLGDPAQDDYASLRQSAAEIGHGRW